jgi:ubiquitin-like 1-activating enzyme E1 A
MSRASSQGKRRNHSSSPTRKLKKVIESNKKIKESLFSQELVNQLNIEDKIKSKEENYTVSMLKKNIQLKLIQNKILLINLTSCMTELSKLLITAGFNIYLYDNEIISKSDAINNIFLTEEDIGKSRLDILYTKLILLNSTVSVIKLKDYTKVKDYKVAIVGFSDFNMLVQYEEYFNRRGIMFFCLNTSGLYGFCYHNLNKKIVENFWSEKEEKMVDVQNSNTNNFLRKSEKFIDKDNIKEKEAIIASVFLLEIYYRKNVHIKNIKKVLLDELNNDSKFMTKIFFIENYLKQKRKITFLNNQYLKDSLRNLIINFNRELNPVCSIMAKKIFIILFKVFKDKIFPKEIMITYNSDNLEDFDYNSFL